MPVRNEVQLITRQLQRLQVYRAAGHEVIVVDGGSSDGSLEIATGLVDRLESSAAGRATQMNRGAALASGDILLFLHVDTSLPDHADQLIFSALTDHDCLWGWFDVRLSNKRLRYRMIAAMMNLRSRISSVCTGDQALFVQRQLFEELGGFPAIELMEDVAISKTLRRRGKPARPGGFAITSSRRWEEKGFIPTLLLMWKLRFLYFIGVSPSRLLAMYYSAHD